jgi:hypothetical protein
VRGVGGQGQQARIAGQLSGAQNAADDADIVFEGAGGPQQGAGGAQCCRGDNSSLKLVLEPCDIERVQAVVAVQDVTKIHKRKS